MSFESVCAIFSFLFPSKDERARRRREDEEIEEFLRTHTITIHTAELTFPKADEERLKDAEAEEKEILKATKKATANGNGGRL